MHGCLYFVLSLCVRIPTQDNIFSHVYLTNCKYFLFILLLVFCFFFLVFFFIKENWFTLFVLQHSEFTKRRNIPNATNERIYMLYSCLSTCCSRSIPCCCVIQRWWCIIDGEQELWGVCCLRSPTALLVRLRVLCLVGNL